MDYFKYFPQIEYSNHKITNVLARTKMLESVKNNSYLYYPYVLGDGERPDIIAERYYGSWKYTWVVLYANDIFDMVRDWPMSEYEFLKYLNYKYSYQNAIDIAGINPTNLTGMEDWDGFRIAHQSIHHYENAQGYVVDSEDWYYETVSEMQRQTYDWSMHNNNPRMIRMRNMRGLPVFINPKTLWTVKTQEKALTAISPASFNGNLKDRVVVIYRPGQENIGIKVDYNDSSTVHLKEKITDIDNGTNLLVWYFDYSDVKSNEYEIQRYNPNSYTTMTFNDSSKKVVSYYRHEYDLNEARRTIKLIDKSYLSQIVNEFRELLGE